MERGKPTRLQLYTKNYRQPKNAESRRNRLTQRKAHLLAVQYQIVNPENTHTSNIQTEQVICRNTGIYV